MYYKSKKDQKCKRKLLFLNSLMHKTNLVLGKKSFKTFRKNLWWLIKNKINLTSSH